MPPISQYAGFTFLVFMDASAFTVAVVPVMKEFGRSATEASYLSAYATTWSR
jgi:hypothetical protein